MKVSWPRNYSEAMVAVQLCLRKAWLLRQRRSSPIQRLSLRVTYDWRI
uniref:Uncharacterized protein n=1 Tax=Rhizophora mucronata TaxID=61149 RepID=A0A2P2PZ33_RHIMU